MEEILIVLLSFTTGLISMIWFWLWGEKKAQAMAGVGESAGCFWAMTCIIIGSAVMIFILAFTDTILL